MRPCCALVLSVFASTGAMAAPPGSTQLAEVQFNDTFLQHPNGTRVDVSRYQSVQTYLQRSIAGLKSQFVIGEAFTDGTMFDSVGFRG
ncbi:fimbria/pilus outer membrane usher protein, partial [Burkholderia gladioli]|uniref:fimbria/pilus outer membrane usher protein n=1 Tax=Burkholderia gladioli TaxID=28095 RepID=UPI003F7B0D2B